MRTACWSGGLRWAELHLYGNTMTGKAYTDNHDAYRLLSEF